MKFLKYSIADLKENVALNYDSEIGRLATRYSTVIIVIDSDSGDLLKSGHSLHGTSSLFLILSPDPHNTLLINS